MKYLLDTCVISDFVKGETNTLKQVKSKTSDDLVISVITLMEINYGLLINPAKAKKIQPIIDEFLSKINILPFNQDDAIKASFIRSYLKSKGTPIGAYDVLIASHALNYQLILVTANEREFTRIPDLIVENWRSL
jgi:tRNA(fMet)-specific endonuclease VapC